MKHHQPYCDGMIRRDFLKIGATGLFGMQFGLADLLAAQAQAANSNPAVRDISLIYVFLKGGMSSIDTFDLKSEAPSEIRGNSIPSPAAFRVCEFVNTCQKSRRIWGSFR